jgi:hypothetical protein
LTKREIPLDYSKKCIESENFKTVLKFVDTKAARKRLDAVAYGLLSGIPILIQVYFFILTI